MGLSWNLWLWVRFPSGPLIRISKSGVYAGVRGSYFYITGNSEEFLVTYKGTDVPKMRTRAKM